MFFDFSIKAAMDCYFVCSCLFLLIWQCLYFVSKQHLCDCGLCGFFQNVVRIRMSLQEGTVKTLYCLTEALLTAMSTTLGIGTIAGPVIAIHLGGPGRFARVSSHIRIRKCCNLHRSQPMR